MSSENNHWTRWEGVVPSTNTLEAYHPVGPKFSAMSAEERTSKVPRAYQNGFSGAFLRSSDGWQKQIANYEYDRFVRNARQPFFSTAASSIQGVGKGKRAINFNYAMRMDPKAFVGSQDYGNCVFASGGWIVMTALRAIRILALGQPDEWIARHGTAWYSSRGHCGQGASMGDFANAVTELGLQLMTTYCDGKYNFTDEDTDEAYGNKHCRSGPPSDLVAETKKHILHTVSAFDSAAGFDGAMDVLFNGGLLHHGSTTTAGGPGDPISPRGPVGSHAQATYGYDDTEEFRDWYKQTTGKTLSEPVFIQGQTWGDWLQVSNWPEHLWGKKPMGAWVVKASSAKSFLLDDDCFAYSPNIDGWEPNSISWSFTQ